MRRRVQWPLSFRFDVQNSLNTFPSFLVECIGWRLRVNRKKKHWEFLRENAWKNVCLFVFVAHPQWCQPMCIVHVRSSRIVKWLFNLNMCAFYPYVYVAPLRITKLDIPHNVKVHSLFFLFVVCTIFVVEVLMQFLLFTFNWTVICIRICAVAFRDYAMQCDPPKVPIY